MVTSGTGTNADIGVEGQWGKTGTTEENGDAWFCGATEEVTACVWVGYADTVTSMATLYNGGPVMGGTYPALIWASVVSAWEEIKAERAAETKSKKDDAEGGDDSGGEEESYVPPSTETESVEPEEEAAPEPEAAPETEAPEAAPETEAPEAAPESRRHRRRHHRRLAGHGRETYGEPARQKRHGRSTALVIPTRGPATISPDQPGGRGSSRNGSRPRSAPLAPRPTPSASVSLPGPEQSSASGRPPRRSRISSMPAVGSSARIRTAAARPRLRRPR